MSYKTTVGAHRFLALAGHAQPVFVVNADGSLSFGVGDSTVVDVTISRTAANQLGLASGDSFIADTLLVRNTGAGSSPTFSSASSSQTLDIAGTIRGTADNAFTVGQAARRYAFNGISYQVFAASGDANPVLKLSSTGVEWGAGGATALSAVLSFSAASLVALGSDDGLKFANMTSATRDANFGASPATSGIVIYNTTTSKLQVSSGGAWVDLH